MTHPPVGQMPARPADRPPLPDPYTPKSGSPDIVVTRYDIEVDYRIISNRLTGQAVLTGSVVRQTASLELDLVGLRAVKASINGSPVRRLTHRQEKLILTPANALAPGDPLAVTVKYEGSPAPRRGPWGDIGWEELNDGVLVAAQPNGAATWFPCNDHPSQKAVFRISVTTDANYRVIANGILAKHSAKARGATWVYEQNEPMATYLATVQVGRYELHPLTEGSTATGSTATGSTAASGRKGHIHQLVAAPRTLLRAARQGLERQQQMMDFFEESFGPYPFDRYTVVVTEDELEIPLEAQTLSILGRNHLDLSWSSERLIAHELAHQWFGNSLTVGRWADIWLHEGFACYAEWLWSEASGSLTAAARARTAWQRLREEPQDILVGSPGPRLMFDDRVYKRGALAVHALRTALGDQEFFSMLRSWTETYRFGSVSTELLIAHVNPVLPEPHGGDAAALLEPWLYSRRLPPWPEAVRRG